MNLDQLFFDNFYTSPESRYKAPARINLIGEHIDYNGGKVLPSCISKYIYAVLSKRDDSQIMLKTTFDAEIKQKSLQNLVYNEEMGWEKYPIGVFYVLQNKGYKIPFGLNIVFDSEIPMASGLSSSAALLDLTVYLANDIYSLGLDRKQITLIAQEVENSYCKLKSGIMDQAIIALGKKNEALLLDCASFTYSYCSMDLGDYEFVVMQTNKPRQLIESKYNERVEECQKALAILKKHYKINNLAELNESELDTIEKLLTDPLLFKRVRHVIKENHRVYLFIDALAKGDVNCLGQLLIDSHLSLKNDYEVTGIHLDTLYESALEAGALGARMTGAGFGGCAIALIKKIDFSSFKEKVLKSYKDKLGIDASVYEVDIVDAVNKVY